MKWFLLKVFLSIALIPTFILITKKLTSPGAITDNIIESVPRFYVLGVKGDKMVMLRLKEAMELKNEYEYHLGQKSVELNIGDIHHIRVIESNDTEQVIAFNYQNSYSSTSTYRVTNNQITPLEYKVNHHIGQGLYFLGAFFLALICSSLFVRVIRKIGKFSGSA